MDLGSIPEGNETSGDNNVDNDDVHHDPLNEYLEETWSALGEQDTRSSTESDPVSTPLNYNILPFQ